MSKIKTNAKILLYTTVIPAAMALCATPVYAEDDPPDRTVRGLAELKRYMNSGQVDGFKNAFSMVLKIFRSICIITVALAFACVFISVIIQAGKLGSASFLAPEGNSRKRQEAYDGLMHAIINFGIIGAAGAIFSALCKFLLGI